jgi:hypothetical protein
MIRSSADLLISLQTLSLVPTAAQEYVFSFTYGEDGLVQLNLTAGATKGKKKADNFGQVGS